MNKVRSSLRWTPICSRLMLLFSFTIVACDSPKRPQVITITKLPAFRPSESGQIETIQQAMATIVSICHHDIGLPIVDPLYINLYQNAASLAYWGKHRPRLPPFEADMPAFAIANTVHINLEIVGRAPWRNLIPLLAHEYAHSINYKMAGDRQRGKAWFHEGFAEWVAAKTLHSLGWQDYDVTLHRAKQELIQHADLLSNLSSFNEEKHWRSELRKPKPWIRTYALAFVAVDRLMQSESFEAIKKYINTDDFDHSFQRSWNEFGADFQDYLTKMTPQRQVSFNMKRPHWNVQDRWIYSSTTAGKKEQVTKEVMREDNYYSIPVYVVSSNDQEDFYSKDSLGAFVTKKNGRLVVTRDKPYEHFNWPLTNDKHWTSSFDFHDLDDNFRATVGRVVIVKGTEEMRVPAGVFRSVRLQAFDSVNGRLMREYWYSPDVKWLVKSRAYDSQGGVMSELLLSSFNFKEKP